MLQGRRVIGGLWAALLVGSLLGLQVLAQDKDKDKDKDKGKDSKDKVTLKWKFEKGKTFYQEMVTTTNQSMKVMNNDVKQKQSQTFYYSWTVDKVEGDSVVLAQKILGVKMDIDIGGSQIKYDSTSASAPNNASNPLSEFFKALVGSEFKLTLNTKDYSVSNVEGRDALLKKLVTANPQMKPLLEQILSDKALKEMAEPTFAVVPTQAIGKSESWDRKTSLDMGPIGKYENSYKYTYEGRDTDKKLEKIKVETTLKYVEPKEGAGVGGLPFKIQSADLKSSDAGGSIYFDSSKGRVESSKLTLKLKGELKIEIGGSSTKVELDQDQETEVKTMDEDPTKKKAA
jgi:hypothetical protein